MVRHHLLECSKKLTDGVVSYRTTSTHWDDNLTIKIARLRLKLCETEDHTYVKWKAQYLKSKKIKEKYAALDECAYLAWCLGQLLIARALPLPLNIDSRLEIR